METAVGTDETFLLNLGGWLRERRKEKGFSQNDLAIKCGIEPASISRIESGRINITIITLKKISEALDIHKIEW